MTQNVGAERPTRAARKVNMSTELDSPCGSDSSAGLGVTCVVTIYGIDVDVVAEYQRRGFTTLPPQLTLSGWDMRALGRVPGSYSIVRDRDITARGIADNEALPVQHGDCFVAVPRTCGCREGECESKPTGCRVAAEIGTDAQ